MNTINPPFMCTPTQQATARFFSSNNKQTNKQNKTHKHPQTKQTKQNTQTKQNKQTR
jgi:hypothetical protein